MSIEHSPARQKKSAGTSALEPLYTRNELATRWHVTPQHVTRHARKLGIQSVRIGKRVLFSESQIIEGERRASAGVNLVEEVTR